MKTIKTIFLLFLVGFFNHKAIAGFTSARIKVTGVTCSMCSNSVHKALSSLTFIDKIDVDLENAVFVIGFKPGEKVSIDDIRKKVEGAGFSVGELVADFTFNKLEIAKDYHYQFEGNVYHFVNVKTQTLDNTVSLRFVDKGLASNKEHKKYVNLTTYSCIKTGYAQNCCAADKGQRVYHITL